MITWISENGALLVRGAGIVTGNVLNKFKRSNILHQSDSSSTNMGSQLTVNSRETDIPQSTTHSSSELQEAYVSRLAQASPASGNTMMGGWNSQASSLISLDSLLTGDGNLLTCLILQHIFSPFPVWKHSRSRQKKHRRRFAFSTNLQSSQHRKSREQDKELHFHAIQTSAC